MGVAVPKVDSGAEAGLYVAGAYQALLDLERDRNARDERRAERMMRAEGFCYHRGELLEERLDAGEAVVLGRAGVECALWYLDRRRVRLPLHRSVRVVRVTAGDVVAPAAG